jgi:hypothetical protein
MSSRDIQTLRGRGADVEENLGDSVVGGALPYRIYCTSRVVSVVWVCGVRSWPPVTAAVDGVPNLSTLHYIPRQSNI